MGGEPLLLDGVLQRQGFQVVHVTGAYPQTPQWGGTQFVRRVRGTSLHDAIAGADVMQEEVGFACGVIER